MPSRTPTRAVMAVGLAAALSYWVVNRETATLNPEERERLGGSYLGPPGAVTHYELCGPEHGQPVVLIHGVTMPLWSWDLQVEAFAAAGFRVLRYDLLGRGWSDRPEERYDRVLYRRQLLQLLDGLNLREPVDIVGHSFGALVTADFAAANPHRVRKLVLASPPNDVRHDRTPLGMLVRIGRLPVLGKWAIRLWVVPLSVRRASKLVTAAGLPPGYYTQLYRQQTIYRGFEQALWGLFRGDAVCDYSHAYREAGRGRDVLVLWGNRDKTVVHRRVREVCRLIPHATIEELDGIGHQPQWEAPERFNELVIRFLSEREPAAPPAG